MCNENRNTIFGIDFSVTSDANNWVTNSSNAIDTIGGKLRLNPDNQNTFFDRTLGAIDPTNNRIRLGIDLEIVRPIGSPDEETNVTVQILQGTKIIGSGTACIINLESSQKATFHLDRTFEFKNVTGILSIRINIPKGYNNLIDICDLKVEDFNFCDDNVRTYFIFDEFFESARNAVSGVIKLTEWKVNNLETLTTDFFNDTAAAILLPAADWFFADSDIDGANRVQDNTDPKSFNPFEKSWALDFVNPIPFHGGKPTGATNGNDYGTGILNIGLEKPQILNGDLDAKNGAVFIDIDYTVDLRIVMDIVINNTTTDLFADASYLRRFSIIWDSKKCVGDFFYDDLLLANPIKVDQLHNGFLYGITGQEIDDSIITCNQQINFNGNKGTTEFIIDFGSDTGQAGITFEAFSVPDKFTIEWDGQIFTTGFVGLNTFDQQLINEGILPADINTGNPTTGAGQLFFNKSSATPTRAIIKVEAPLEGTAWNIIGLCPQITANDPVEVGIGTCDSIPSVWNSVFVNTVDILTFVPQNGDVIFTDAALTIPFNGSDNIYRMRIPTFPSKLILNVQFKIDAIGVVSELQPCKLVTGGILIESAFSDVCGSCWVITVNVPVSETRQVEFLSTFQSVAVYDTGTRCTSPPLSTTIFGNGITNISTTTKFAFGIDAAQLIVDDFESKITVINRDGATIIDAQEFKRTHANAIC